MCIAKATSGSWEPPTLKERFDLPTEGFICFRSATSGHGANTRMLLSRQVKFDSRQKRNVAEFIVEPPCYGCVSCSKICPGWGVTEGHLLAMAPFAARHKTRRRKFLMADAEIILFSSRVSREILLTLMSTKLATEAKTATSASSHRSRMNFLANRQEPGKSRGPLTFALLGRDLHESDAVGPPENRMYSSRDVAGYVSANYTVACIVDSHDTVSAKALVVQVGRTRV
jgi:hypothetical protein